MHHALMQDRADQPIERGNREYDFRTLALLAITITRPDLLHEYLEGGKEKVNGVPVALKDETLWPTFRRFGMPIDMLGEALYLFEREDVQRALTTCQVLLRTTVAYNTYCPDGCHNNASFESFIPFTALLTERLKPAGVEIEQEVENKSCR